MVRSILRGSLTPAQILSVLALLAGPVTSVPGQTTTPRTSIIRKLETASERMEMTVNTSRILTLDQKIPQAQVNNPEILQITPLSPTQIQVSAKKAGVTQVNLWDENNQVYTVDVIVFGDARELIELFRSCFPSASLQVTPVANSVFISGHVDQPEHVELIIRLAEEYYPKVINNIIVTGVQQVVLHVKVMEVSRTKLRTLGFDFAKLTGRNMVVSAVTGVLAGASAAGVSGTDDATFLFQVLEGSSGFFGVLEALRDDQLMKILAEPDLLTYSGRPASFQVGGEFPILVPQSLGTVSVEFKKFGTQLDFVPIVLGGGKIRLEVRPRVSEIDNTRSVTIMSTEVPGLRVREVETGVEMRAGQTLAIAGLVQNRIEAQRRGLPWVSEVPYLGALFRVVRETNNEIELLILVTPELVDPLNDHEVPQCGPGLRTDSPNDWELYMKGHIEVPRCCPPGWSAAEYFPYKHGATMGQPMGPDTAHLPGMILHQQSAETTGIQEAVGPTVKPQSPPEGASRPRRRPAMRAADSRAIRPARYNPPSRQSRPATAKATQNKSLPGFIGPVGYDVVK